MPILYVLARATTRSFALRSRRLHESGNIALRSRSVAAGAACVTTAVVPRFRIIPCLPSYSSLGIEFPDRKLLCKSVTVGPCLYRSCLRYDVLCHAQHLVRDDSKHLEYEHLGYIPHHLVSNDSKHSYTSQPCVRKTVGHISRSAPLLSLSRNP